MRKNLIKIMLIAIIVLFPMESFSLEANTENRVLNDYISNYNNTNNNLSQFNSYNFEENNKYIKQKEYGILDFLSLVVDMFSLYNGFKDMQASEKLYNANPSQENLNKMLFDSNSYYYDMSQAMEKYNNVQK